MIENQKLIEHRETRKRELKRRKNGFLTELQDKFVDKVVREGLSYTAAAAAIGLKDPDMRGRYLGASKRVKAALQKRKEEFRRDVRVTRIEVVEGMKEAIDLAKLKGDPTAMIAGWREIGKLCGLYEPQKVEIGLSPSGEALIRSFSSKSDEELVRIMEGSDVMDVEFVEVVDEDQERGTERASLPDLGP